MRRHLALILGAVLVLSPLEGVAQEKQIVDVTELAGAWRGGVTREQGHEPRIPRGAFTAAGEFKILAVA